MASPPENSLLSAQKSTSGISIALHPLVLLTISDYITRHTLRNQRGPVVGGLIGQQNGSEVTVEHAFEFLLNCADDTINEEWFNKRLGQMLDVHKSPELEFVGWYTLMSPSGPRRHHLAIHSRLSSMLSVSPVLVGFHPEAALEDSVGGKLPLTIYETTAVPEENKNVAEDPLAGLKFAELPYTMETGEAEMIAIDFVAQGGGNATAVESTKRPTEPSPPTKGKKKPIPKAEKDGAAAPENLVLSREEEELISSLTAKANAIKMLHSRINLIAAYLSKLPPSYLNGKEDEKEPGEKQSLVNHSILRSIQALLSRLALLIPSDKIAFNQELLAEQNDVNLINLLSTMTQSIQTAREMGRKHKTIQSLRGGDEDKKVGFDISAFGQLGMGRSPGLGDLVASENKI